MNRKPEMNSSDNWFTKQVAQCEETHYPAMAFNDSSKLLRLQGSGV